MSHAYGWVGKLLWVDLSSRTTRTLNTLDYGPAYIGGRGLAARRPDLIERARAEGRLDAHDERWLARHARPAGQGGVPGEVEGRPEPGPVGNGDEKPL